MSGVEGQSHRNKQKCAPSARQTYLGGTGLDGERWKEDKDKLMKDTSCELCQREKVRGRKA